MKTHFRLLLLSLFLLLISSSADAASQFINTGEGFLWIGTNQAAPILIDKDEDKGIMRAVCNLQSDALNVTGKNPALSYDPSSSKMLIIGCVNTSKWIKELIKNKQIDSSELCGKQEKYLITSIKNPFKDVDEAVVIAGSDKRGTIYGIYELSAQMGVSPWYYWADVPVKKSESVFIAPGTYTDGEPAVRYRGIFLNDEWPCLGKWANYSFGGLNSKFYEKVFELILRLKGNFLWPAMWGSAFYDDDPLNGPLADEMGIVMSTSHHEPMALAQQDWKRRGSGPWNYTTNSKILTDFWKSGIQRCKNWETIVTVGMRGDGDEPMSENANIRLLQNIVKDQRSIIRQVTKKPAEKTPQVWALYKEVQDYYDKGMRVPDDVTLMLCDDNWGNVRKLPALNAKPRKGGYGMYYHFDYVGAPRNTKWINTNQIERTWEQMNLSYEYGVREIWVVNVGDLKPMEFPISFFMAMAWNPSQFNHENLHQYAIDFCSQQFGNEFAEEAAGIIESYSKFNRRVTPEMLNASTFSLDNYNEWTTVYQDYQNLCLKALKLFYLLPDEYKDAYDQLILYPVQACANLYEMYYSLALNQKYAKENNPLANDFAQKVKECFQRDSILTYHYNNIMSNGKWKHIMDQTHIGYTSWNDPQFNIMPQTATLEPVIRKANKFLETDGYVSVEAGHYTRLSNCSAAKWIVIPNLGRTLSGITTWPATATPSKDMYLEYDFVTEKECQAEILVRFSATLNFNSNKGLSYAISLDGAPEQIININGHYMGELGKWQAEHVIDSKSEHLCCKAQQHTLRIRPLDPALVIQKIMIDLGGLKTSFLGAPESTSIDQK